MRVLIYADARQTKEIRGKPKPPNVEIVFSTMFPSEKDINGYDVFFLLKDEYTLRKKEKNGKESTNPDLEDLSNIDFKGKQVIFHSVITTLAKAGLPDNFSRINAWRGFLQRDIWEIATPENFPSPEIFDILGWKTLRVKDEAGLVAARVIAMIINEAFFALKDNISTPQEIDLAMKKGTNYPLGPFEWVNQIGIAPVFDLLLELSKTDKRYTPSFKKDESYPDSH